MVEYKGLQCNTLFKKYSNGNTKIELIDPLTLISIVVATTNIDRLENNEVAIRDNSDHRDILEVLMKAGIVSKPHRYINSEYFNVPICKLINYRFI